MHEMSREIARRVIIIPAQMKQVEYVTCTPARGGSHGAESKSNS
ncbi:transposase IS66 [Alicyclobacillus hesperidum URH17-3-68]|nr:transposase IS66 [Alicyclobacillus hesperidum URH17-3-68]